MGFEFSPFRDTIRLTLTRWAVLSAMRAVLTELLPYMQEKRREAELIQQLIHTKRTKRTAGAGVRVLHQTPIEAL